MLLSEQQLLSHKAKSCNLLNNKRKRYQIIHNIDVLPLYRKAKLHTHVDSSNHSMTMLVLQEGRRDTGTVSFNVKAW